MADSEPVIIEAAINGATHEGAQPEHAPPARRDRGRRARRASTRVPRSCTTTSTSSACPATRPPSATSRVGAPVFDRAARRAPLPHDELRTRRRGRVLAHGAARRQGQAPHRDHRPRLGEPRRLSTPTGCPPHPASSTRTPSATSATRPSLRRELQLGPSMAIFEPGWLRTALLYWRGREAAAGGDGQALLRWRCRLRHPGNAQRAGATFGLPPTRDGARRVLRAARRLRPPVVGRGHRRRIYRSPMVRLALERGAHLHVGLEDYAGERQPTNLELVREAVALCDEVGRPVATADEAATILDLPRPAPEHRTEPTERADRSAVEVRDALGEVELDPPAAGAAVGGLEPTVPRREARLLLVRRHEQEAHASPRSSHRESPTLSSPFTGSSSSSSS